MGFGITKHFDQKQRFPLLIEKWKTDFEVLMEAL